MRHGGAQAGNQRFQLVAQLLLKRFGRGRRRAQGTVQLEGQVAQAFELGGVEAVAVAQGHGGAHFGFEIGQVLAGLQLTAQAAGLREVVVERGAVVHRAAAHLGCGQLDGKQAGLHQNAHNGEGLAQHAVVGGRPVVGVGRKPPQRGGADLQATLDGVVFEAGEIFVRKQHGVGTRQGYP